MLREKLLEVSGILAMLDVRAELMRLLDGDLAVAKGAKST
jgi:hypothetical protein